MTHFYRFFPVISRSKFFHLFCLVFLFIQLPSFGQQDSLPIKKIKKTSNTSPHKDHICKTDELMQKKMREDAALKLKVEKNESALFTHQLEKKKNPLRSERILSLYTVPVVVHVVHSNGSENISDAQVLKGIQHLNNAFRKIAPFTGSGGADMEIEFCVATKDDNGDPSTGINRVVSGLTSLDMDNQDQELKNLVRWNPLNYVNIWIVKEICSGGTCNNTLGYAYLAAAHGQAYDGIVIDADYFGSSSDNSKVLVHEMGHYLNLLHTFNEGCINNNCMINGDRVCDTPPDQSTGAAPCGIPPNTCSTDADDISTNNPFRPVALGGLGDQNDMINNYMDYSSLACMNAFTPGQKERMVFALTSIRNSLLTSNGCSTPCPSPIIGSFTSSPISPFNAGTTVNFTNTTTGASAYIWKINGTTFSTSQHPSYTFNAQGNYSITMTASNADATCTKTVSMSIDVLCDANAKFTTSTRKIDVGNSVLFTNTSTGSINYKWFINTVFQSSATNFNPVFPLKGNYLVYLVSDNGICSDTSSKIIISVGMTEQDCIDAIPVCESVYYQDISYFEHGNIQEGLTSSCLFAENSSVWYIFTVTKSGLLTMEVVPNDETDDYDFAIYDLTQSSCSDILNDSAMEVRCNYSADPDTTGLTIGATGVSEDAEGSNRSAPLEVIEGQTYVLLLDNFSMSTSGYKLVFGGTAQIFDPIPPKALRVDYKNCDQIDTINLYLGKPVVCPSIQTDGSDFYITGPTNHTVIKAYSDDCSSGSFTTHIKIILDVPITDADTYELHFKNGSDNNTLIDNCGNALSTNDYLSFSLHQGPSVELGPNTPICTHALLAAGPGFVKYTWHDGSSQPTFNADTSGKYWVEVEDHCARTASDTIYLSLYDETAPQLGNDTSICQGGIVKILHAGPGYRNYLWNDRSTDSTLTVWQGGTYWVAAETFCGLIFKDTIKISTIVSPELRIAGLTNLYCLDTTEVTLSGSPSGGTFTGPITSDGIFNIETAGEGIHTIVYNYDFNGCITSTSMQTEVIECPAPIIPEILYIPNLITPNQDFHNDYFEVKGLEKNSLLEIYNIWGKLIYRSSDYDNKWNGDTNSEGLYYYTLTIPSTKKEYKGWIHLVK